MDPCISDFGDYGDSRDWSSFSGGISAGGFPGKMHPRYGAQSVGPYTLNRAFRGAPTLSGCRQSRINPYDANQGNRFQIAIGIRNTRDFVTGRADYMHLRRLTVGVDGTGESFVTHAMTDLVRNVLGFDVESKVFAHTWISAFQAGGPASRRILRLPNGKRSFGLLGPIKCAPLREAQENLLQCALFVGDEREMIGRSMMGRLDYRAPLPPFDSARPEGVPI